MKKTKIIKIMADPIFIVPTLLALLALVLSLMSYRVAREAHGLALEDFFAQRTVILQASLRPLLGDNAGKSIGDKMKSDDKSDVAAGFMELMKVYRNNSFLVFKPSRWPSGIKDITVYLPPVVDGLKSAHIRNVSGGSLEHYLRQMGLVGEQEFAAPFVMIGPKLYKYLIENTPAINKKLAGTLNNVLLPVGLELDSLVKGRRVKEYQIYEASIGYQVDEHDLVTISTFSISFIERLKSIKKLQTTMEGNSSKIQFRFSDPLPRDENGDSILDVRNIESFQAYDLGPNS